MERGGKSGSASAAGAERGVEGVLEHGPGEAATLEEAGEPTTGGLGIEPGQLPGPLLGHRDRELALALVVDRLECGLDRLVRDLAAAKLGEDGRSALALALGLAADDRLGQPGVVEVVPVAEALDL